MTLHRLPRLPHSRHPLQRITRLLAPLLLSGCASVAPSSSLLLGEAEEAYRQGDYPRAESAYTSLLDQHPSNAHVLFRLGNVHLHQNQPEKAIKAYRAALVYQPHEARAWHNLALAHLLQTEQVLQESLTTLTAEHPAREGLDRLAERIALLRSGE